MVDNGCGQCGYVHSWGKYNNLMALSMPRTTVFLLALVLSQIQSNQLSIRQTVNTETKVTDVLGLLIDLRPPVCQSWGVLVSQTDFLSQVMKKCSEDLLSGPISKLTLLIRDKQQLRKTYSEQWNLLKQELSKVCMLKHAHTHTHTRFHNYLKDVTSKQSRQTFDCGNTDENCWHWTLNSFPLLMSLSTFCRINWHSRKTRWNKMPN